MNYTQLLEALNQVSLFDLYRLKSALANELDNPVKLNAVKQHLRPGTMARYFDPPTNRLIECTIEEVKRTRALVRNLHDGKRWTIPFFMFNLDGTDTEIHAASNQTGLARNQIQVGERLGFFNTRENREVYGEVQKLNQKTVTLLEQGPKGVIRWRVDYHLLFKVIEGDKKQEYLPR